MNRIPDVNEPGTIYLGLYQERMHGKKQDSLPLQEYAAKGRLKVLLVDDSKRICNLIDLFKKQTFRLKSQNLIFWKMLVLDGLLWRDYRNNESSRFLEYTCHQIICCYIEYFWGFCAFVNV